MVQNETVIRRWRGLIVAILSLSFTPGLLSASDWPSGQEPRLLLNQRVSELVEPGKPFTVDISVRNSGGGDARSVSVYDELPPGVEVVEASPIPTRDNNTLQWSLASIKPGEVYNIRLRLRCDKVPPGGEWINRARLAYLSEVGNVCAIDIKRPKVLMTVDAPRYALLGQETPVTINIRNAGHWTGHRLNLSASLNGVVSHESGGDLENEIGDLAAGKSCSLTLPVKASTVGKGNLQLRLASEEGVERVGLAISVLDARPELVINGPGTCSSGWACTYNFILSAKGPDSLPAGMLKATLPGNLSFARASGSGSYDAKSKTITWPVPGCKPGESLTYVLCGNARDGKPHEGSLRLMDGHRVLKHTPWNLRLIDTASEPAAKGKP